MNDIIPLRHNKPTIKLVGVDGNAFIILGMCNSLLKKNNFTDEEINEFRTSATSGDYDNLLTTVQEWFNVE